MKEQFDPLHREKGQIVPFSSAPVRRVDFDENGGFGQKPSSEENSFLEQMNN